MNQNVMDVKDCYKNLVTKSSSYMLRRPKKFTKSPTNIWLAVHRTNNWWRFRKIVWPSQTIWTLTIKITGRLFISIDFLCSQKYLTINFTELLSRILCQMFRDNRYDLKIIDLYLQLLVNIKSMKPNWKKQTGLGGWIFIFQSSH